jgi:hypothetical protein
VQPLRLEGLAWRKEYDALEEEFSIMAAVAKARRRAGLSQAELARRMKTTQSTPWRGWKAAAASPPRARYSGSQKRPATGSGSAFSR